MSQAKGAIYRLITLQQHVGNTSHALCLTLHIGNCSTSSLSVDLMPLCSHCPTSQLLDSCSRSVAYNHGTKQCLDVSASKTVMWIALKQSKEQTDAKVGTFLQPNNVGQTIHWATAVACSMRRWRSPIPVVALLLVSGIYCEWNPRLLSLTAPMLSASKASHAAKFSAPANHAMRVVHWADCWCSIDT